MNRKTVRSNCVHAHALSGSSSSSSSSLGVGGGSRAGNGGDHFLHTYSRRCSPNGIVRAVCVRIECGFGACVLVCISCGPAGAAHVKLSRTHFLLPTAQHRGIHCIICSSQHIHNSLELVLRRAPPHKISTTTGVYAAEQPQRIRTTHIRLQQQHTHIRTCSVLQLGTMLRTNKHTHA